MIPPVTPTAIPMVAERLEVFADWEPSAAIAVSVGIVVDVVVEPTVTDRAGSVEVLASVGPTKPMVVKGLAS